MIGKMKGIEMRKWLIGIIKEAINEQHLNTVTKVLANRDPTEDDYNYKPGAVWLNGDDHFYLDTIEAVWKPVKDMEEE